MSYQLAFINGSTLKALRERRKVSPEYLCQKADIKLNQLEMWEQGSGTDYPTMKQAEKMAKVLLSPLAGLYLKPCNLPVETVPVMVNKRRIRNACMVDESALHLAVYGLAQVRSDAIALAGETGVTFHRFNLPKLNGTYADAVAIIRDWIGLSLDNQKRTTSARKLFLALRTRLEERGALVVQFDGVEVEELRGLALYFDELPIIGVNAKDHWPAQCFTMLHELVHLSRRSSVYCNLVCMEADDEEEVFCNFVAGEFLFSRACVEQEVKSGLNPRDLDSIEKVSRRYSVSRDVVARRLYDCKYLDKHAYEDLLDIFARQIAEEKEEQRRKKEAGEKTGWPAPYERKVADSFGSLYCQLVAQGLSFGLLSERDACSAFGVEAEKLGKVFKEALA